MRYIVSLFVALLSITVQAQTKTDALRSMPLLERGEFLIRYFEGWHSGNGYVGWGHRIQPGEKLSYNMSRKEADSLLRADLLKLYGHFKGYGEYAFILAILSYNTGFAKVEGGGRYKPSRLIQKIKQGRKDIEADYLDFCHWKGKAIPSIQRRRWVEFHYLYAQ